jgi:hypothetical protein
MISFKVCHKIFTKYPPKTITSSLAAHLNSLQREVEFKDAGELLALSHYGEAASKDTLDIRSEVFQGNEYYLVVTSVKTAPLFGCVKERIIVLSTFAFGESLGVPLKDFLAFMTGLLLIELLAPGIDYHSGNPSCPRSRDSDRTDLKKYFANGQLCVTCEAMLQKYDREVGLIPGSVEAAKSILAAVAQNYAPSSDQSVGPNLPLIHPRFGGSVSSEDRETFEKFCRKADEIEAHSVFREQKFNPVLRIQSTQEGRATTTQTGFDPEMYGSFATLVRQFYADKEPINFKRVKNIAFRYTKDSSDVLCGSIKAALDIFESALGNTKVRIDIRGQLYTREELVDLWFYGHVFHSDSEKASLWFELMAGDLRADTLFEVGTALKTVSGAVLQLAAILQESFL